MDDKNLLVYCVMFLVGTLAWLSLTIYMLFHSMPMMTLFSAVAFFCTVNSALQIDLDKLKKM